MQKLLQGRLTGPIIRILLPAAIAALLIYSEPWLTYLAQTRPGVLPVAMVVLLGGLLLGRVRRWLIVTLCYGITLLAARDVILAYNGILIPPSLPAVIDYVNVEAVYSVVRSLHPYGWALLAMLSAVAGTLEAIRPGSVVARRYYFGSAALYFMGHAFFGLVKQPSWESIVLLLIGLVAFAGIFLAHRIVAAEEVADQEDEDIRQMAASLRRRAENLALREWRDNSSEHLPPAAKS